MMSEWKDVSRAMRAGMPVWPGDPPVAVRPVARIGEDGASSNVSLWSFSSHAGTHVDPPLHFVPGAPGADALDLGVLCGPCRVMDLSSEDGHITARLLEGGAGDDERILLKTRNSARPRDAFHEDFTAITPDAARWLVDHGVRLIGTDGPSIEAFGSEDFAVHHTLLENAVVVVEGLALADVAPGRYEMICAPLKWKDADGAPARVLLRTLP
jgi:arylformamidase